MRTTVSTKGQIILPASMRKLDRIEPGQVFEVERLAQGRYKLTRTAGPDGTGLVDLLLDCPVKGWFQRAPRREDTRDIRPPRLA